MSRIGLSAPAGYVDDFLQGVSKEWKAGSKEYFHQGKKVDAILVDEAQLFPGSRRLMEIADVIEEVPTVC
jgi:thymidine kinase